MQDATDHTEILRNAAGKWKILRALWSPVPGPDLTWATLPAAAMHPVTMLVAAVLGVALWKPRRRAALVGLAFIVGLCPSLGGPDDISTHRLLPALCMLPFAVAMALD